MAYKDFKDYIQKNYKKEIREALDHFVGCRHDTRGFHNVNVFNLCDQEVTNIQVLGLRCKDDIGYFIDMELGVKADIVTLAFGVDKDIEQSRESAWFTIRVRPQLHNGLHDFVIYDVDTYIPEKFSKEGELDQYLIPYIYADQLEEEADDFFAFYCDKAIYREGWTLPIDYIIGQLGIEYHEAPLPEKVFGRMYFRESEEDYYVRYPGFGTIPPQKKLVHGKVTPGTLLISPDNHFVFNDGTGLTTIAHEIVHWDKHQKFFEVLALLSDGEDSLSCEVTPDVSPDNLVGVEKAIWWAEWQANALAPRLLMPRALFIQLFEQIHKEQSRIPYKHTGEVMERTLDKLGKCFSVSKYIAKVRALQLGYKTAEGAWINVDGHYYRPFTFNPEALDDYETFVLDRKNYDRLMSSDAKFASLINDGLFVYTGYVVAINSPLYAKSVDEPFLSSTGVELTDYSLEHADLCCLKFKREYKPNDSYGDYYNLCYLSKDVNAEEFKEVRSIDYSKNQDVQAEAEGLKEYDDEGGRLAEILNSLPPTFWGTFDAHMNRLKKEEKLTNEEMHFRTGLSEKHIRELRKGDENVQRTTVYALAIAMHLHPYLSEDFVRKGGGYPLTQEGMFYRTLIERHYMEPLSYINEKLKSRGYKPWGDESKILDVDTNAIQEDKE